MVEIFIGRRSWQGKSCRVVVRLGGTGSLGFGGANVFSDLVKVAFGGGDGVWWILCEQLGAKPREGGQVVLVKGLE